MKKILFLLVIAAMVFNFSCASNLGTFKEPTADNTMLIIGHVIIEDDYFTEEVNDYRANIEVAIVGKTTAGKDVSYWSKTDEEGYYSVADAPMGEYALKGLRTIIGRPSSAITIVNRLRLSNDTYRVSNSEQPITFTSQYYPYEPVDRIQSLQHVILKLDKMSSQTGQVNTTERFIIKDYKLANGEILNLSPVEDYFLQKYPTSAWAPMLEKSKSTPRFKR